jgi:hypothetical protein
VLSPDFEKGVYKIMSGKSEEISPSEREACVSLLKTNWNHLYPRVAVVEDQQQEDSPVRFFMKRMKEKGTSESHKKKPRSNNASIYISDLSWIHSTTVDVERLFSECSSVMTAPRRKMFPRIFESIVFLRKNSMWWDVHLVQEMVVGKFKDSLTRDYNYLDIPDDSVEGEY